MTIRRLVAIPFVAVGAYQVLLCLLLTVASLWLTIPLTFSIVAVTCLLRCVLSTPSRKLESTAWLLTFIAWSVYHLFFALAYWSPRIAGVGVHFDHWFIPTAIATWMGSLAMFILCARRDGRIK